MRIPGPYSDDTWQWLPNARDAGEPAPKVSSANSAAHVAWELGLVLVVPLCGAGIVALLFKAFNIY